MQHEVKVVELVVNLQIIKLEMDQQHQVVMEERDLKEIKGVKVISHEVVMEETEVI